MDAEAQRVLAATLYAALLRAGSEPIRLGELWEIAGSPADQTPEKWLAKEYTKGLIIALIKARVPAVMDPGDLVVHKTDGVWADQLLGIAYGEELSAAFMALMSELLLEAGPSIMSVAKKTIRPKTWS